MCLVGVAGVVRAKVVAADLTMGAKPSLGVVVVRAKVVTSILMMEGLR